VTTASDVHNSLVDWFTQKFGSPYKSTEKDSLINGVNITRSKVYWKDKRGNELRVQLGTSSMEQGIISLKSKKQIEFEEKHETEIKEKLTKLFIGTKNEKDLIEKLINDMKRADP
jgi:hypothetical protein